MLRALRRAVERELTLPVTADGPMIGVKPLFSGRSLGEGENATFDVVFASPDGASLARNGLRYELLKVETKYQWYRRDGTWDFEPVKSTRRIADGTIDVAATRAAARTQIGPVQQCYERARMDDPSLTGTVQARITIGPDGTVSKVDIASSTLGAPSVESCIRQAIARWRLPRPSGGVAAALTYPLVFQ